MYKSCLQPGSEWIQSLNPRTIDITIINLREYSLIKWVHTGDVTVFVTAQVIAVFSMLLELVEMVGGDG